MMALVDAAGLPDDADREVVTFAHSGVLGALHGGRATAAPSRAGLYCLGSDL
jgi:hypothetical protein